MNAHKPAGSDNLATDPALIAERIRKGDAYLTPYLLGWFGMADPQPWGAAMSFALEAAHGYGLIKGESNATATPLGLEVAKLLQVQP